MASDPKKKPELNLRDLRALPPLILIDIAVGYWVRTHFDSAIGWPAMLAPLTGFIGVMAYFGGEIRDGIKKALVATLKSRRLEKRLWYAFGAIVVAGSFTTSVHVKSAKPTGKTELFVMESSATGSREVSRDHFDQVTPHADFVMFTWPIGRMITVQSGEGTETEVKRALPWSRRSVTHSTDFLGMSSLYVLPTASYLADLAGQSKLTVVVRRMADGDTLVRDTISRVTSLVLAPREPATPDSATQLQWTKSLADLLGVEPARASFITNEWMKPRWVRAAAPLKPDEKLEIVVERANGEVVSRDTVSLKREPTYAIIRKKG